MVINNPNARVITKHLTNDAGFILMVLFMPCK
jgi:hypothetical protein